MDSWIFGTEKNSCYREFEMSKFRVIERILHYLIYKWLGAWNSLRVNESRLYIKDVKTLPALPTPKGQLFVELTCIRVNIYRKNCSFLKKLYKYLKQKTYSAFFCTNWIIIIRVIEIVSSLKKCQEQRRTADVKYILLFFYPKVELG